MKYIINGHAEHGKDFFADALSKELGLKKLNSSLWFAEKHIMRMFPGKYSCAEEAYLDRVNHRSLWYELMRAVDWQLEFMQISDVFCGHRNVKEHEDMVWSLAKTGVLRIWVRWLGKEAEDPSSTQWNTNKNVIQNHDLVLGHTGNGVEHMLLQVKDAVACQLSR